MNTNNNASGKTYTRAVFLMCLNDANYYEPIAVFPDIYWDAAKTCWMCYQHVGQHGACCKQFALCDCIPPRARDRRSVERLKAELENLDEPYVLEVLDAAQWQNDNAELAKQLVKNSKHYEDVQEETGNVHATAEHEQYVNSFSVDDFADTKKAISELFDEEFADLKADENKDYSDLSDELTYPPMVVAVA